MIKTISCQINSNPVAAISQAILSFRLFKYVLKNIFQRDRKDLKNKNSRFPVFQTNICLRFLWSRANSDCPNLTIRITHILWIFRVIADLWY